MLPVKAMSWVRGLFDQVRADLLAEAGQKVDDAVGEAGVLGRSP